MRHKTNKKWQTMRELVQTGTAVIATGITWKITSAIALAERGYSAVGGELLITFLSYYATYKLTAFLFDRLEDYCYEQHRKEAGDKKDIGYADSRGIV